MSLTRFRSTTLCDGAEYHYGTLVPAGTSLVYLAGACPIDAAGNTVALGDVAGQAHQVMANLRVALAEAGVAPAGVVRTTVYVASAHQADLVTAWNVHHDFFGEHEPPSTLVGVTCLGYDGQLVEVEAVAAIPAAPR
ncbi:MAG: RidA family protein [Mycobacteriales bacterium]